jgi:hypothetical protein
MNNDHDNDRDRDHANDNGEHEKAGSNKPVASAPAGGALTSLAALQTALAGVNKAAILGRTGLPMLQFKREGSGTWMYGQKRTIPEPGSRWAINPMTFMWGYVCFGGDKKVLDKRIVSVSQPKPLVTELPDLGFPWQEEWSVNMKCLTGADAGVEAVYTMSTDGGTKSISTMLGHVLDRLNSGQHDGKVVPIVSLDKDSYPHKEHGKVWIPVLDNNIEWMSLDGPAPAPAPEPAPESPSPPEQPRRRRVA